MAKQLLIRLAALALIFPLMAPGYVVALTAIELGVPAPWCFVLGAPFVWLSVQLLRPVFKRLERIAGLT